MLEYLMSHPAAEWMLLWAIIMGLLIITFSVISSLVLGVIGISRALKQRRAMTGLRDVIDILKQTVEANRVDNPQMAGLAKLMLHAIMKGASDLTPEEVSYIKEQMNLEA